MKLCLAALQSLRPARWFYFAAFLALFLILLFLPRSPLPWLDEVYYASAALAVLRGGPSVPTIFGAFPHTARLDLLYGPVISSLGSVELRFFGLSATSWRLLGFWGAVVAVVSASWLSRRLDRAPGAAAAAAMFVAWSQGIGARATSGRLDTITVALELLSLTCTLCAVQTTLRRSGFVYAVLAGLFCGIAALSTPRSFPFALGLFAALALEVALARDFVLAMKGLMTGTTALATVSAWTFSQGMSPMGWLRFIAAGSRGDKLNVSPLLHGSWQVFAGPHVPLLSGLLVMLVMVMVFGATLMGGTVVIGNRDSVSAVRLASITVLMNYIALFLMISRFWDYEIFVVPLIVPVVTALTSKILRNGRPAYQSLVLMSWVLLALFLIAVRSGKVMVWLASYDQRDSQLLQDFIQHKVPINSRVFGPDDYYFYAVERAGSHYLFVRLIIPTALQSKLDHKIKWQEQVKSGPAAYLIWPNNENLPADLYPVNLELEGSFTEKREEAISGWKQAWVSGYPPTNLYRIVAARDVSENLPATSSR